MTPTWCWLGPLRPVPGISRLQARRCAQVSIRNYFRNIVCFHFNKGADSSRTILDLILI